MKDLMSKLKKFQRPAERFLFPLQFALPFQGDDFVFPVPKLHQDIALPHGIVPGNETFYDDTVLSSVNHAPFPFQK